MLKNKKAIGSQENTGEIWLFLKIYDIKFFE